MEEKPRVHIGVIGHVDHSKTTLTAAIEQVLAAKKSGRGVGDESEESVSKSAVDKVEFEKKQGCVPVV